MSMALITNCAQHDRPGGDLVCGSGGCKTTVILLALLCLSCAVEADESTPGNFKPSGELADRPLWRIAIERMRDQGGYVAARVETDMKVFDGDEKLLGSVTEVERMERSGERFHWRTVSKNTSGNPGMTIKADFGLQANPSSVLEGYDQWYRRSVGEFEGGRIEVWEGISSADPKNSIVAYIDPVAGLLKRAEFTMPFRSPVGSIIVKGELTCQRLPGDIWLPSQITMDQTGRLFFVKRHLHMVKNYKEWQLRTGKSLSAIPRTKTEKQ